MMKKANDIIFLSGLKYGQSDVGWSRYQGPYPIASQLRRVGYSVAVIDFITERNDLSDLLTACLSPKTQIIALSSTFLTNSFDGRSNPLQMWFSNLREARDWWRHLLKVKEEICPQARFVVGGHQVEAIIEQAEDSSEIVSAIDLFVVGNGEGVIEKYLSGDLSIRIENGLRVHRGLDYGSGICYTTHFSSQEAIQPGEWLPLEVSRGCRFNCKYCFYKKRGSELKNTVDLKEELLRNYEYWGVTGYHLCDDTFNDSRTKVDKICDLFTSLPFAIEWIAYARPDQFALQPGTAEQVLEAGARGLFCGIESLDAKARKISGKSVAPEQIIETLTQIKNLARGRCFVNGSFIIGLPGETRESLEKTYHWLRRQDMIDFIQFEVLYISGPQRVNASYYSTNPEKSDILQFQKDPYYWRHSTLDYLQAVEIAKTWQGGLMEAENSSVVSHHNEQSNFWLYPRYRSLGYNHEESLQCLKGQGGRQKEAIKRHQRWLQRYYRQLSSQPMLQYPSKAPKHKQIPGAPQ